MKDYNRVYDILNKNIAYEEDYQRLKEVRQQCYRVFEDDISFEEMEPIITNEWPKLYKCTGVVISDEHIRFTFSKLKKGIINRREFKETLEGTIKDIDAVYETLGERVVTSEERLILRYNQFFKDDNPGLNDVERYIYHVLRDESAKKIIINFLKS